MKLKRSKLIKLVRYEEHTGVFYSRKTDTVISKLDYDHRCVYVWVDKQRYHAGKLAWYYVKGEWPKHGVIYKDGVWFNNWFNNLQRNKFVRTYADNTPRIDGVYWNKACNNWRVQALVKGKQKSLGSFKTFDQAVLARYKAEKELDHGCGKYLGVTPAQQYIDKMFL